MPDVLLSPHFALSEFTKSDTAIRLGIKNSAPQEHIDNMKELCRHVLEPVRDHYRTSIHLTSGYRSKELNAKVGGSKTSQHSSGQAADFEVAGTPNIDVVKWIRDNLDYDQIILEFYDPSKGPNSGWVHVSYNAKHNRKEVLTAQVVAGKTVYKQGLPH